MSQHPDIPALVPLPVITGKLYRPINAEIEQLLCQALEHSAGKVLYRDNHGRHQELHFAQGLAAALQQSQSIRGTRCFFNLEQHQPRLISQLCPPLFNADVIKRLNLYVSPSSAGAPLHFDKNAVIIVQLSGNKLWQVSTTPASPAPTHNVVADEMNNIAHYQQQPLPLPSHMHTVHLTVGQWLLVPRGYWHATYTQRGSVSATLALDNNRSPWQGHSMPPFCDDTIDTSQLCQSPPITRRLASNTQRNST